MTNQTAQVTDHIATDLPLDVDLSESDEPAEDDAEPTDTMRRVAPEDGSRLLVAAAFNSAI